MRNPTSACPGLPDPARGTSQRSRNCPESGPPYPQSGSCWTKRIVSATDGFEADSFPKIKKLEQKLGIQSNRRSSARPEGPSPRRETFAQPHHSRESGNPSPVAGLYRRSPFPLMVRLSNHVRRTTPRHNGTVPTPVFVGCGVGCQHERFPRRRESRVAARRGPSPHHSPRPKSNQIANPTPKLPPRPQKQTIALFPLSSFRKREKTLNYPPKLNIQTRPPAPPWVPALGDLCITVIPAPPPPSCPRKREPRVAAQSGASPITAPDWWGLLHPPNLVLHGELRKGLLSRE